MESSAAIIQKWYREHVHKITQSAKHNLKPAIDEMKRRLTPRPLDEFPEANAASIIQKNYRTFLLKTLVKYSNLKRWVEKQIKDEELWGLSENDYIEAGRINKYDKYVKYCYNCIYFKGEGICKNCTQFDLDGVIRSCKHEQEIKEHNENIEKAYNEYSDICEFEHSIYIDDATLLSYDDWWVKLGAKQFNKPYTEQEKQEFQENEIKLCGRYPYKI